MSGTKPKAKSKARAKPARRPAGAPAVPAARVVPVGRVAEILNLSQRRLGQLVDEGMPRAGQGKYDLDACASWYIRYLQNIVEKNPRVQRGVEGTSVAIEKARNLALDNELRELRLQEARGEVASVSEMVALWEDAILRARSRAQSAVDGHLDQIIEAKTRPRARDAGVGLLHEFLEEMVRLADEVESEEGSAPAGETNSGPQDKPRRSARPRRPRKQPAAAD